MLLTYTVANISIKKKQNAKEDVSHQHPMKDESCDNSGNILKCSLAALHRLDSYQLLASVPFLLKAKVKWFAVLLNNATSHPAKARRVSRSASLLCTIREQISLLFYLKVK